MTKSAFEKSVQQIKKARKELDKGISCTCGGIMRYTGSVGLHKLATGFVDMYEIKCDKCGKKDHFVAKVEHIGKR